MVSMWTRQSEVTPRRSDLRVACRKIKDFHKRPHRCKDHHSTRLRSLSCRAPVEYLSASGTHLTMLSDTHENKSTFGCMHAVAKCLIQVSIAKIRMSRLHHPASGNVHRSTQSPPPTQNVVTSAPKGQFCPKTFFNHFTWAPIKRVILMKAPT